MDTISAIQQLRDWLHANGRKQVELCEATGEPKDRVCRFLKGTAGLSGPGAYAALERLTQISGLAVRLAAEAPRRRTPGPPRKQAKTKPTEKPAVVVNEAPDAEVALEVAEGQQLFDPGLPARLAEAVGRPEAAALFGAMLRLAFTARSEGVRRAAASDLLDRLCGKAVQRVLDTTPRPPAENAELLLVLQQLAGDDAEKPLAPPSGVPLAS